jgi:hypothetical protein
LGQCQKVQYFKKETSLIIFPRILQSDKVVLSKNVEKHIIIHDKRPYEILSGIGGFGSSKRFFDEYPVDIQVSEPQ